MTSPSCRYDEQRGGRVPTTVITHHHRRLTMDVTDAINVFDVVPTKENRHEKLPSPH